MSWQFINTQQLLIYGIIGLFLIICILSGIIWLLCRKVKALLWMKHMGEQYGLWKT